MLAFSSIFQNLNLGIGDKFQKQVIKYLLQRYVGQFLEEELSVDQLTVEIISGTGIIKHLTLNVNALNEIAEQLNLPFKFVDGYIGEICLSVPWKSLLSENCFVEVTGLVLTLHPKQRDEDVSLVDSMINSMSTSMQIAHECLSQVEAQTGDHLGNFYSDSSKDDNAEGGGDARSEVPGIDALELFAQAIDTVLNRTKVRFIDSVIRLVFAPETSTVGIALEIRINKIDYFDEAGLDKDGLKEKKEQKENSSESFTSKKFLVEGVTLYTDEYSTSYSKSRSYSSKYDLDSSIVEEVHQNSSKFNTYINTSIDLTSANEEYNSTLYSENFFSNNSFNNCDSNPILCAKVYGCQEIKVRLRQNDTFHGPKVQIEGNCGSLMAFVSPRQVHLILEFATGFVTPDELHKDNIYAGRGHIKSNQKPMDQKDFQKVEHELLKHLSPPNLIPSQALGLGQAFEQGWSSPPDLFNDDDFHPVNPIQEQFPYSKSRVNPMTSSMRSELTELDTSFTSTLSGHPPHCSSVASKKNQNNENEIHMSFKVRINSLGIVLLHEDILLPLVDQEENLANASIADMQSKSKDFFTCVGNIWHSENSHKEFMDLNEKLQSSCSLSHIRIICCPISVDGIEKSQLNRWDRKTTLTMGCFEIVENIYEDGSNKIISPLLSFKKMEPQVQSQFSMSMKPKAQISITESQNITIISGNSQRLSIPKIEVKISLEECSTDIDFSIIDRMSTLFNKQPIINKKDFMFSPDLPPSHLDNQMFFLKRIMDENNSKPEAKLSMLISCPLLNLKLYIPIPDLRPISDMGRIPWWKRNVRKETILFSFEDFYLESSSSPSIKFDRYEIRSTDMHIQFKLDDNGPPISLARASVSQGTERGFDPVRIVFDVYPTQSPNDLGENEPVNENLMSKSMMGFLELDEDNIASLFGKWKVASQQREKLIEVTVPASKEERNRFIDQSLENVQFKVDIQFPELQFILPTKHIYELLYNRVVSDLLLWAPSAPNLFNRVHSNLTDIGFGIQPGLQSRNFQNFTPFTVFNSFQYDNEEPSSDFLTLQNDNCDKESHEESLNGQTMVSASIYIGNFVGSIRTPYKDMEEKVLPDQHGEICITAKESYIFAASGYKGNKDLCYTCISANKAHMYHKASEVTTSNPPILSNIIPLSPRNLGAVLYPSDFLNKMEGGANPEYSNTESLVLCIKTSFDVKKNEKLFILAGGLNYSTLRHYMLPSNEHWTTQLADMFNVEDYPIEGYTLPEVITEINFHLENCSIDYRPLFLPVKSFITIDSLSISSNLSLLGDSSVLLILIEDAGLFLSQNFNTKKVLLKNDYVCIANLGVLEICMKVHEDVNGSPTQELNLSNNNIHIRTCSDSCKLFMELLIYLVNEGDLIKEANSKTSENVCKLHPSESKEAVFSPTLGRTSEINFMESMLQEAMLEKSPDKRNFKCNTSSPNNNSNGVEVFFFPDENYKCFQGSPKSYNKPESLNKSKVLLESFVPDTELALKEASQNFSIEDDEYVSRDWDDEFCILDKVPGSGIKSPSGKPNFKAFSETLINADENFFNVSPGKDKANKSVFSTPVHSLLAKPLMQYNLQELTLVWHIYGGCDFQSTSNLSANDKNGNNKNVPISLKGNKPKAKVSAVSFCNGEAKINSVQASPVLQRNNGIMKWYAVGGPGRSHDFLMELQLSKIKFKYDVYPSDSKIMSRHFLTINDIEIRDRLSSSKINKFLYQYSSESCPRQAQANMLNIKAVTIKNDSCSTSPEAILRVSLRPIRLNIDQDSLIFLLQFFENLVVDKDCVIGEEEFPSYCSKPSPQIPVISKCVRSPHCASNNENKEFNMEVDKGNGGPSSIYFKSFVFSPDVPIKIDYQGKHIDINSQYGAIYGLLIGLGQLNHSEITLKRVEFPNGILGVPKLIDALSNEWQTDIRKNQLPSILGGVGPMHSFVKLYGGVKDLFWLPIENYQKDGSVFRGLQRGTSSFTTNSAIAALDLSGQFVGCIQSAAETMYDMVSSGPSVRNKSYRKQNRQPQDIREGVSTAYSVVRNGIGDTINTIYQAAAEEHSLKGMSGAVGGVLRQIPPTVVQPIILASEATCTVIGGLTNQLVPDARKEAAEKWKA